VREANLVRRCIHGIDDAGPPNMARAVMHHLHRSVLGLRSGGMTLAGMRRCHRSGTAEIDAERWGGGLAGGEGAGIGAGDEGDRHQARRPRAVKKTTH
jgi:hypothetical protein